MKMATHNLHKKLLMGSALTLLLSLCTIACTPPQVNLQQAKLSKLTTTGFRIMMNLSIFNPNAYTLPLSSVGWDLNVFNRALTRGSVNTNNQITASSTSPVSVPLGIRFSSVSMGVKDFMSGRDIPWGIAGKCNFKTPAGPIYVNFAKKGQWKSPLQNGGGIRLGDLDEDQSMDEPVIVTREASLTIEVPRLNVAASL